MRRSRTSNSRLSAGAVGAREQGISASSLVRRIRRKITRHRAMKSRTSWRNTGQCDRTILILMSALWSGLFLRSMGGHYVV